MSGVSRAVRTVGGVGAGMLLALAAAAPGPPMTAATADSDPAPASITTATVTGGDRRDCPELTVRRVEVLGGCALEVSAADTTFEVVTMFGDHSLGECPMLLRLQIGPEGSIGIADLTLLASSGRSAGPCADIDACRRRLPDGRWTDDKLAWRGRLTSSEGRFTATVDACFDTCLGRFEGRATLRLSPTRQGGWRLRASRTTVGTSGLELSGSWDLSPPTGRLLLEAS